MWLLSALPAPADAGDFEIRLAGQRCLGMRAGRFLGATEQHAVSLVAGADLAEADDVYGVHARRCKVSAIGCQALFAMIARPINSGIWGIKELPNASRRFTRSGTPLATRGTPGHSPSAQAFSPAASSPWGDPLRTRRNSD